MLHTIIDCDSPNDFKKMSLILSSSENYELEDHVIEEAAEENNLPNGLSIINYSLFTRMYLR